MRIQPNSQSPLQKWIFGNKDKPALLQFSLVFFFWSDIFPRIVGVLDEKIFKKVNYWTDLSTEKSKRWRQRHLTVANLVFRIFLQRQAALDSSSYTNVLTKAICKYFAHGKNLSIILFQNKHWVPEISSQV